MAANSSNMTTDHEQIMTWAESRGGHPATVKRTGGNGGVGILRIDFPGYSGKQSLEQISWSEFFDKFEKEHLAFLYQDKTSAGKPSRFCKIVSREHAGSRTRH